MKRVLTFAVILLLAACSFERSAGENWVISLPAPQPMATAAKQGADIKVLLPVMESDLATLRVALTRSDGARDYYATMRWPDVLPLHVQQSVIARLAASGNFRSVVGDDVALPTPYRLTLQVQSFDVRYGADGRPNATVSFAYILTHRFKDVGSGTVAGEAVAYSESPDAIKAAFGSAFDTAMDQLVLQIGKKAVK